MSNVELHNGQSEKRRTAKKRQEEMLCFIFSNCCRGSRIWSHWDVHSMKQSLMKTMKH